MQTFLLTIGGVGSLASLISLITLNSSWQGRIIHATYLAIFAAISIVAINQNFKLSQIRDIQQDAAEMVEHHRMDYTDRGFVQATLAFLEKHRAVFPETYERAKSMCEERGCFDGTADNVDMVGISYEMKGLLTGIATLSN